MKSKQEGFYFFLTTMKKDQKFKTVIIFYHRSKESHNV